MPVCKQKTIAATSVGAISSLLSLAIAAASLAATPSTVDASKTAIMAPRTTRNMTSAAPGIPARVTTNPKRQPEQVQRSLARRNVWLIPTRTMRLHYIKNELRTKGTPHERHEVVRSENAQQSMNQLGISQSEQFAYTEHSTSSNTSNSKNESKLSAEAQARLRERSIIVTDGRGERQVTVLDLGNKGSILVADKANLRVDAGQSSIQIAPNTIAYVVKTDDEMAVYNFAGGGRQALQVEIAPSHRVSVGTGQVLIVSSAKDLKDSRLSENVDVSTLKKLDPTAKSGNVFLADFAYTSAFDACPQVIECMNSAQPGQKKIATRLLKAAAASIVAAP